MNKNFLLVTLLLFISIPTVAQTKSPINEMVETEYACASAAKEKTVREAFMEFIADDGLLFRPGSVNGKKWMNEHPVPPTTKHQLLAWQPSFAGMSRAGDLGFTTGPWEYKEDINDQKVAGYGHFVTVWNKQADGKWRFLVDLGISHPNSGGPLNNWKPDIDRAGSTGTVVDGAKETQLLLNRDRTVSTRTVVNKNLADAFRTYAAPMPVSIYLNNFHSLDAKLQLLH